MKGPQEEQEEMIQRIPPVADQVDQIIVQKYLPENPPPYTPFETNSRKTSISSTKSIGESRENQIGEKAQFLRSRFCFAGLVLICVGLLLVCIGILTPILYKLHFLSATDRQLLLAAEAGRTQEVESLLDSGADVNSRLPEFQGRTALHLAAMHGHADTVRLLLVRGANATARSSLGWQTPLHLAANDGCKAEVVEMLLDAGARVEDRDAHGKNAMDYPNSPGCHGALFNRSKIKVTIEHARKQMQALEQFKKETEGMDIFEKMRRHREFMEKMRINWSNTSDSKF